MRAGLLAALLAAIGSACAPTVLQLTPRGQQVQLVSTPPADLRLGYAELGTVTCSRGDGFLPRRSAETNIVHCQHQLRNKAAEMDAHVVVLTSQQLGAGECGACVTLVGTAYRRKGP